MRYGYKLFFSRVWRPFEDGQRYAFITNTNGPRYVYPDKKERLKDGEYIHVAHDNAMLDAVVSIQNDEKKTKAKMTTYKYRDEASQEIHTLQIGDKYRKWSQDVDVDPYPATFADDEGDARLLTLGKIIEVWDDATETWWPSVVVEIIDDVSFLDAAEIGTKQAEAEVEDDASLVTERSVRLSNEALRASIVESSGESVTADESRSYAYLIAHGRIIGQAFTSLRSGPVDYGRMTDGTFVKVGRARVTRSKGVENKAKKMENVEFFAVNLGGGGSL